MSGKSWEDEMNIINTYSMEFSKEKKNYVYRGSNNWMAWWVIKKPKEEDEELRRVCSREGGQNWKERVGRGNGKDTVYTNENFKEEKH